MKKAKIVPLNCQSSPCNIFAADTVELTEYPKQRKGMLLALATCPE